MSAGKILPIVIAAENPAFKRRPFFPFFFHDHNSIVDNLKSQDRIVKAVENDDLDSIGPESMRKRIFKPELLPTISQKC